VDGSCWATDLRLSLVKGAACLQGNSVTSLSTLHEEAMTRSWEGSCRWPSGPAPMPGLLAGPLLSPHLRPGPLPPPCWAPSCRVIRVFLWPQSRLASNIRLTSLRQPRPLFASLLWLRFLGTTGAFEHRRTYFE
jgi:hypothetical protein